MLIHFREWHERNLYFWGTWGAPEIEWAISRLLQPGDIFVDAGCNVGYFTLLGAKLVGRTGKVFSFEPSPSTSERCRKNIEINGYPQVSLFQKAVSNVTGIATLYQPETGCDLATLRGEVDKKNPASTMQFTVDTICLDTFLPRETAGKIKLVKIDVEGAEFKVLEGMRNILSSPSGPDIICEVNNKFLQEMGTSAIEVIEFLRQLGYFIYLFNGKELSPLETLPDLESFDIYCTKERGKENPLLGKSAE